MTSSGSESGACIKSMIGERGRSCYFFQGRKYRRPSVRARTSKRVSGSQRDHSTDETCNERGGKGLGYIHFREGNVVRTTESQATTTTKLTRIAWLSSQDRHKQFTTLMHLYNEESLRTCFNELDGKKAVGSDGVDKISYGNNLEENLQNLMSRMRQMNYRPRPVRQVLISKEGKPGAYRALGIGNFEDKIVQKMTQKVLESIYEPLFLPCSYGFRPGRGCHDAIRDIYHYLYRNEIQTVIDVDISNFFGTIDHATLLDIVQQKIRDERFLRYLARMFKAGVLADGELAINDEGVPQGSPCSPVLANIMAHYVIDEWFEYIVKPRCLGKVELFRYCDDIVICCQHQNDALRINKGLIQRLGKYHLSLNQEKTKLVSFSKREIVCGKKQQTFDFLGFTFYWGRSRRGYVVPQIKTSAQRLRCKLKNVKLWAKRTKDTEELKQWWKRFCIKLRGHHQYYGVSTNSSGLNSFQHEALRIAFKWLNRRSQRKSFDWRRFLLFQKLYPPPQPKIYHRLF